MHSCSRADPQVGMVNADSAGFFVEQGYPIRS